MTSLFTVILEFGGGTYISQVKAQGPSEALTEWITTQSDADLSSWKLDRTKMAKLFAEESPHLLDGLQNAWCMSASLANGFALANIIKTVPAN
ncbi:MAG: hypothetical protein ABI286_02730 [Edaphobacter sp.]